MKTMKKFRLLWPWDDEKEAGWLRTMALQGWHFKSVHPLGFYTFEGGAFGNVYYRLDFFYRSQNHILLFPILSR